VNVCVCGVGFVVNVCVCGVGFVENVCVCGVGFGSNLDVMLAFGGSAYEAIWGQMGESQRDQLVCQTCLYAMSAVCTLFLQYHTRYTYRYTYIGNIRWIL
jgi:hypothetical protein